MLNGIMKYQRPRLKKGIDLKRSNLCKVNWNIQSILNAGNTWKTSKADKSFKTHKYVWLVLNNELSKAALSKFRGKQQTEEASGQPESGNWNLQSFHLSLFSIISQSASSSPIFLKDVSKWCVGTGWGTPSAPQRKTQHTPSAQCNKLGQFRYRCSRSLLGRNRIDTWSTYITRLKTPS